MRAARLVIITELIASADHRSLLVHGGQHDYTALQYIVNGPTWLENRWHRTGITECWIHSNTSVVKRHRSCGQESTII